MTSTDLLPALFAPLAYIIPEEPNRTLIPSCSKSRFVGNPDVIAQGPD